MDVLWRTIESQAEQNNGFIKTSQIEELGISRTALRKYVENGKLNQVKKGLYVLADGFVDEYVLLQTQSSKIIFGYGTALFLWDMSDRAPHIFDVVVPQGTNTSKLKQTTPNIRCHYVKPELHGLGVTETQTPQGGTVKLYDRERCICDLIRDKNDMDMQLFSHAMKEYFKNKPNPRKLLKYGKQFGIEDKIRTYMEVLQ